jgi:hypothetical protein
MRRMSPARRGPLATALTALSAGLAGLFCCLALGGCSGSDPGPAPTTMHPGTAATPTTATPSGNPTENAYASAIAAVEKMYVEYNLALRSGRTAAYRATFANTCGYCQQNAKFIDANTGRGRSIVGGQFTLTRMHKATIHESDIYVQGRASETAARIVESGKTIQRFKAAPSFLVLWTVRQIGEKWIVTKEEVPR